MDGQSPFGVTLGKDVATNAANTAAFGLLGGIMDLFKMKKQNKYAQENAQLANQITQEQMQLSNDLQLGSWQTMFDKQNARQDELLRNQKSMEVNALRNAGLNPSLASGQSSLAAVSSPSASGSAGNGIVPSGPISNMTSLGYQSQLANIHLMESQADKNEADADKSREESITEALLRTLRIENQEFVNKTQRLMPYLIGAQTATQDAMTGYYFQYAQQLERLTPQMVSQINSQVKLNEQAFDINAAKLPYEIQQYTAGIALLYEQSKTEQSKQAVNSAQVSQLAAAVNELNAIAAEAMSRIPVNDAEAGHKKAQMLNEYYNALNALVNYGNEKARKEWLDDDGPLLWKDRRSRGLWLEQFGPLVGASAGPASAAAMLKMLK